MKFSRLYAPSIDANGHFSVEPYVADDPAPQTSPGGARQSWISEADLIQTLQEAEDAVAQYLPLLKLGKHLKANNMKVDAALISKINADPSASLDLTAQSAAISV